MNSNKAQNLTGQLPQSYLAQIEDNLPIKTSSSQSRHQGQKMEYSLTRLSQRFNLALMGI